jgi:hypothetical protein
MFVRMIVKPVVGRINGGELEEDEEVIIPKVGRFSDFPVRSQWLRFLALSCVNLFNPYMPNRSGYFVSL